MFSQVVWSYLYLRLHAARLLSMMAARKQQQQKGLLTISGHQHRFKYENSSNKSKVLAHRDWNIHMRFFTFIILQMCQAQKPCTSSLMHLLRNNSENNTKWSLQAVRMISWLKREKERGNIGCIRSWDGVERTELRDSPGDSKFTSGCQWLTFDDLLAIQESRIKKEEDHQFPCCRTKWINLWDAILVCGIWRTVAPNYQNTSKSLPRIKTKMQKIKPNPIFSFLTDESFGGKRDWPNTRLYLFFNVHKFQTLCRDLMPLLNLRITIIEKIT